MLIPFKELIDKYNFRPRGVLHVGASHGEEYEAYMAEHVVDQVWIEAIPEIACKCSAKVKDNQDARVFNNCISDKSGKVVTFHVTSNVGQSSSILPLKKHAEIYPSIVVEKKLTLTTITIDKLLKRHQINAAQYDFMNIDLQGAELLALKGATNTLKSINYIYCEVNTAELYEGCPMVEEIDAFLYQFGFAPKECKMTDANWGDKFYMRINGK